MVYGVKNLRRKIVKMFLVIVDETTELGRFDTVRYDYSLDPALFYGIYSYRDGYTKKNHSFVVASIHPLWGIEK